MARTRCISVLFMFMLLTFTHSQALAGFYSGNDLVALMKEYDKADAGAKVVDGNKVFEYAGYILGVYDATDFLLSIPANANKGQIIAIVSKYLKNHPEQWSEPAPVLVGRALREAFPLRKSQ